jgi:CRISPR system Cascade subunit CasD
MKSFLLFSIYAPLSSWGDIAVGEARGSWDRPSRSAVFGLVAAALGIIREDQEAHDALDEQHGMAVRLDAAGAPMTDYHTAQTVASAAVRKARPATRAALLAAGEHETILSRRTYRQDALATIALWQRGDARWTLNDLADALRRPTFVLYAGRKANALGLPLDPQLVNAETLAAALKSRSPLPAGLDRRVTHELLPRQGWGTEVAHDPCTGFDSGLREGRVVTRRDTRAHRTRWQFAERAVQIGSPVSRNPEAGGS